MEGREFEGAIPQEITGVSPIIEQQQEMPPVPTEQQEVLQVSVEPKTEEVRQSEPQPRQHKSKVERKFDMFVEEDEKRKKSPVEEGAPKSEFEKGLVEALKDPEMAHEVALSVKPLEDLIAEKKADIGNLFTEVKEIGKRADELGRLPDEKDRDFRERRDKIYREGSNKARELEDRLGLMKDFLWDAEANQRRIIDAFERVRLAKLAGGDEPLKAGENFLLNYVGVVLSTKRQEGKSAEIDRRARYKDIMNEGTFLEKMILRLKEEEYKVEKMPDEMLLTEFVVDKIKQRRIISSAEEEAKKILGSLGIEGADSLSYSQIMKDFRF